MNFSKVRSVNIWPITWIWQVDSLRQDQSFRNEPDDDYHEVDTAFVSYQVPRGFAWISECRSGRVYVGRASRIIPLVFCRSAGYDDHQTGSGVAVPSECPAGYDRVL